MATDEEDLERRSQMVRGVFRRHRSRAAGTYGNYGSGGRNRPRPRKNGDLAERGDAAHDAKDAQGDGGWVAPPGTYRSKTGTRTSRWDPQDIGAILRDETSRRGWERTLSVASVSADWDQIVGPQVALHCPISSFEGGVLIAQADSTAWAEQLRLLLPHIQRRIDERVGTGIVEKVVVLAPKAPSWVHGARHIPGRGPRDTYG